MTHFFDFLINTAYADSPAAQAASGAGNMSFFVMFFIFFIFIYFAIWRPQNKRAREQQNLLNSIAKGDEVVTTGGLLGRIVKLNEQYITLGVAAQAEIVVQKSSIVSVLPKGTLKSLE